MDDMGLVKTLRLEVVSATNRCMTKNFYIIPVLFQLILGSFLGVVTPSLVAQEKTIPPNASSVSTIVGAWEHTLTKTRCKEIYIFRADGTLTVLSGNRRFEDHYEIDPQPDKHGLFKLTGVTQLNTDGIDCTGRSKNYVGKPYTVYIRFENHDKYRIYYSPGDVKEFGLLRRVTR
jgi:hypothetical protein